MIKEAENQKYIIINNFKVFVGLPIICKKTMTINKTDDIKNNEEFEVTYFDNKTLRIADGNTRGGFALLRDDLSNLKSTALNKSINLGTGTITAAGFTGPLTGNVTGNVTGTVTNGVVTTGSYNNPAWITGIAASKITGTITSASSLTTSRNINGVAFDGTASISINTLVNGANTVSLGSTGITTFPGVINAGNIKNLVVNDLGGGTSLTAGSQIQIGNSAGDGAGVLIKNAVTNILGGETSLESGSKIQMDSGNVSLSSYTYNSISSSTGLESRLVVEVDNSYLNNVIRIGTRIINSGVESPTNVFQGVTFSQYGDITTANGTVTASAVTTTNDVTVGGNAVISTKPTLKTHATNRGYVDKKAVAMAVALG
jgi:hypothetical protein